MGSALRRQMRWLGYAAAGAAGAAALPLVWAAAVEPYWVDWHEETVALPGLPAAWRGQRVALIGDLQVGIRFANVRAIRRIVERLIAERPLLVLPATAEIYTAVREPARQIDAVVRLVRPLP